MSVEDTISAFQKFNSSVMELGSEEGQTPPFEQALKNIFKSEKMKDDDDACKTYVVGAPNHRCPQTCCVALCAP